MKKSTRANRGIIHTILLVLAGILLLSIFGIDLREAASKPLVQKNFQFIWSSVKGAWVDYVFNPITGRTSTSTPESTEPTLP